MTDPEDDPPPAPPGIQGTTPLEARLTGRFPSLRFALRGLDGRVTWIMLLAALLLVVFRKFGGSHTFEAYLAPDSLKRHPYLTVYGDYYWFTACFVLLGLIPALATQPRALRPTYDGLGPGDWRFGLKWAAILYAVMLPVVIVASFWPEFWMYYPLNGTLASDAPKFFSGSGEAPERFLSHFIAYEVLYAVYFVGWEYFFRGFLTLGLYARLGVNAVFVANIPFALLHVGKPFPEALGSIIAGVALGLFALRAGSFWYCWILHAAIAWTMDAAAVLRRTLEAP